MKKLISITFLYILLSGFQGNTHSEYYIYMDRYFCLDCFSKIDKILKKDSSQKDIFYFTSPNYTSQSEAYGLIIKNNLGIKAQFIETDSNWHKNHLKPKDLDLINKGASPRLFRKLPNKNKLLRVF